jgi:hypothetical protein
MKKRTKLKLPSLNLSKIKKMVGEEERYLSTSGKGCVC